MARVMPSLCLRAVHLASALTTLLLILNVLAASMRSRSVLATRPRHRIAFIPESLEQPVQAAAQRSIWLRRILAVYIISALTAPNTSAVHRRLPIPMAGGTARPDQIDISPRFLRQT